MARDKTLIIGNWKMNLGVHDSSLYLHKLAKVVKIHRNVEVVIAPTILALQTLSVQVNLRQIKLAAQNFYYRDHGAYTGEVSATMLRGIVQYVLVGHSERRHVFHESDKDIRAKVQAAIRNDIRPILCVGETAGEKAADETKDVLFDQLIGGLANVTSEELEKIVIAYEPVWAIGTGKNALPPDVTFAIQAIRSQLKHLYGAKAAANIQVLYGGSVTADSAAAYLELPDVDGLLIGGASLDAHIFSGIIEKAYTIKK
ncbi:MAG: triose-phosphate isomerase [Candidatus Microsaccharimonas sossegonensis]|uniref:Triosephosphate isomerase n=1 Tax=Candidatus Microsaccharimonas sossegonensis TaxID=2506948 RepID=A0A4Q0AGV7_9BACT|nr:MAG: triose-phosphate isomerase [Candidatus Microsaccharimonas sossegonensis]